MRPTSYTGRRRAGRRQSWECADTVPLPAIATVLPVPVLPRAVDPWFGVAGFRPKLWTVAAQREARHLAATSRKARP